MSRLIHFDRLPATTIRRLRDRAKALDLDDIGFAWTVEKEAESRIVAKLTALLPGSYYMDPPDGGDVPVMEQLRRMAEDAAKYRDSSAGNKAEDAAVRNLMQAVEQILDAGHMNQEDLARLRAAWNAVPACEPCGTPNCLEHGVPSGVRLATEA
jgi:hypothetical protein